MRGHHDPISGTPPDFIHPSGATLIVQRGGVSISSSSGTIGSAFATGRNSFDALRLVAAVMVIMAHSYPLLNKGGLDPLPGWTGGYDGGTLAVNLFFVLSGFLVTRSAEYRGITEYFLARALRILPALVVAIILQAFVLGPLVTSLPFGEYFSSAKVYRSLESILIFGIRYDLPGVFNGNALTAVNGSLWTLPAEVSFYMLLPGLLVIKLLRKGWICGLFLLTITAAFAPARLGFEADTMKQAIFWVPISQWLRWATSFVAGVTLWLHRDDVPLSAGLAMCATILWFGSVNQLIGPWVFAISYPYIVVYVGLAYPQGQPWSASLGDLSYGTYLYGFPVQQTIIAKTGLQLPWAVTLVAIPCAVALGYLSWWLIERPALQFKARRAAITIS